MHKEHTHCSSSILVTTKAAMDLQVQLWKENSFYFAGKNLVE